MLQADTRANGQTNSMNDVWKQWEGQLADGRFPLRRYLGESDRGPVFLTESGGPEPQREAIKLTAADPQTTDAQMARWTKASSLSHPHLLRIFGTGRCEAGGARMIYAVMECADENLSQVVPVRALTETEAREMLRPVLEALTYLHGKGLAHGHIKPSNIMALENELKISSDGICALREKPIGRSRPTPYDAPEAGTRGASAAGDIWSLGVTLVEVLTQKLPTWEWKGQEEPELPRMAAPFGEIAKACLKRDPQRRCTLGEIASRLDPDAPPLGMLLPVATKAAPAPAPPVARTAPAPRAAKEVGRPAEREIRTGRKSPTARLVAPAAAVLIALALVAIGAVKLWNRGSAGASNGGGEFVAANPQPRAEAADPTPPTNKRASVKTEASKTMAATAPAPYLPPAATASAPPPAPKPVMKRAAAGVGGGVAHQVVPKVPTKALETIHGTVRVGVRVQVDSHGKVVGERLESAGPSKYFATFAEKASRDWEFLPPTADGEPTASEWILRFDFTQDGARTTATRALR